MKSIKGSSINFTELTTKQLVEWIKANKNSSFLHFNKPLSCCLQLPIPTSKNQVNFVLDKLEWLVTDEGKAYSEYFNFIEDYE